MSIEHPLTTPLIQENPLALRVLGLCPALAITNSLTSALIMSAALTVVLVISNTIISLVRKLLPSSVRLIVQITIIASAVTVIDQFLKAFLPDAAARLSVYVALIITNCMVLGRAEGCAMKEDVRTSILDAIGNGAGFSMILVIVAVLGLMALLIPRIFAAYDERQQRLDEPCHTSQPGVSLPELGLGEALNRIGEQAVDV